jgi:hypothetical protein
MQMFGLDITTILITAGFIGFWGVMLLGFFWFYSKNPYIPRKYYKVKLVNKNHQFLRYCKGWCVTTRHVPYFRIGLRDFPSFKAVEKDVAIMEGMDDEGIITVVEDVPDKYVVTNYTLKDIPITQKDELIRELCENIEESSRPTFALKVKDLLNKHSREVDLNTSKATKEYINQARREAERVKGDDFISKYGPILALVLACLFAYLILDGSVKAYQSAMGQSNAVMENGYRQIIASCGGNFQSYNVMTNTTAPAPKQGVQIPFITT